jgi:hypothetical protein
LVIFARTYSGGMKNIHVILIVIAVVYGLTTIFALRQNISLISGDGRYFFAWLHTIVVDKDLDFTDEYTQLGISESYAWDSRHHPAFIVSPGASILWLPFYAIPYMFLGGSEYELIYEISVSIGTLFYVIIGILLLYKVLTKYFSQHIAGITILCIALGTNLFYYTTISPAYSHGLTFFITALLIWLLEYKHSFIYVGISYGMLYLTRIQDGLVFLIALPYLSGKIRNYMKVVFPYMVCILFQVFIWYQIYHRFMISPYLVFINTPTDSFRILDTLFSLDFGLFFRTPILLLASIGLLYSMTKITYIKYYLLSLFAQLLFISFVWNPGFSYSHRYFVTFLPIFAFGLAGFLNALSFYKIHVAIIYSLMGCLIVFNILGSLRLSGLI